MPEPYAPLVFEQFPVAGAFPISGRFGATGAPWSAERPHRGVDIACPEGTTVHAPAAGRVVDFTNDGSFGIAVCLDHVGTKWYSLYAHLALVSVKVGDDVAAGEQLGRSGATGQVSGPHLHWQVCESTTFPVDIALSADPLSFLRTTPPAPVPSLEARVASLEAWQRQINAALVTTRFPLIALALEADLSLVERALAVLRREGIVQ